MTLGLISVYISFVVMMMTENEITEKVIGCAITVHRALGPGLLESSYQRCLECELAENGLMFTSQPGIPLVYKNVKLEVGYRLDILVEGKVVVEVKSVEALTDVHTAQVITYLKLCSAPVGLLINFNVFQLTKGIRRIATREYLEELKKAL